MMYEFRNAKYSRADNSAIDVEIDHPEFGWLPHTVISGTGDQDMQELFDAAVAGGVAAFEAPAVSGAMIDAERDRRIDAGFLFNGALFQSRPEDRENIMGAATGALGAMQDGAVAGDLRWHGGDTDFAWITADNGIMPLDALSMYALGQAAMKHKQDHIFAARALKDMSPPPSDFTDDEHWPDTA